jgi:putative GTP pyrophosphokinase
MRQNKFSQCPLGNCYDFLEKYNVRLSKYKACNLKWEELTKIFIDYKKFMSDLEPLPEFLSSILAKGPYVHAVKGRVKDPEHLIHKIIRKSIEEGYPYATLNNYKDVIKDLVGVRALHLFNEEWKEVHKYIFSKFKVIGKPEAKIRMGDSDRLKEMYQNADPPCSIEDAQDYRSVHYTIEREEANIKISMEIQARTLFEEARSEIDHRIIYPIKPTDDKLEFLIRMMSRLAGKGDEIGSAMLARHMRNNTKGVLQRKLNKLYENICRSLEKPPFPIDGILERENGMLTAEPLLKALETKRDT